MDAVSQVMNCKKINAVVGSASAATEFIRDDKGLITHIIAFLYDTTFTKNGTRLTEKSGDMSKDSFLDKDLIVTPNMDHNVFIDEPGVMPAGGVVPLVKPLQDYITAGARFSVGKIKEVIKKQIAVGNNGDTMPVWRGVIKLTSEPFKRMLTELADKYKDIRDAKLFVSSFYGGFPTITAMASQESNTKVVYEGPVTAIHLALVKSPAFNETRSLISGLCSGTDSICSMQLGNASYNNTSNIVEEFNNHLVTISTKLYGNSNNATNMTEDNKDNSPVKAAESKDKEVKPTENKDNDKVTVLENQVKELTETIKKLAEKKPEDKPKEDKAKDKEESPLEKQLKEQEAKIKELQRERDIRIMMEKLAPLQDKKLIEKQATIFIDKNYTDEEVKEFIKNFGSKPVAVAHSNNKTDSAIDYYAVANSQDVGKEGSHKLTNIGIASLLNQLT